MVAVAGPAFTVGAGLMVIITVDTAAGHGPAGSFVVIVKVTVPAAMSPAEGVYVGVTEVVLLNVPLPLDVQVTDVALPPIEPGTE